MIVLVGIHNQTSEEYLHVNCCGYHRITEYDVPNLVPEGYRDFQLLYVRSGRFEVIFPEGKRYACPGDLVVYRPGDPQLYVHYAKDQPEVYWIHFAGIGSWDIMERAGICRNDIIPLGYFPEFVDGIRSIVREMQLDSTNAQMVCTGTLLQLLGMVSRRVEKGIDSKKFSGLDAALQDMCESYQFNRSVEEYAEMAHLSPSRFTKLFREYTGMPPHAYLTHIRLEQAKSLLRKSSFSVTEISQICGYTDPLYFSRIFTKHVGCAPSIFASEQGKTTESGGGK